MTLQNSNGTTDIDGVVDITNQSYPFGVQTNTVDYNTAIRNKPTSSTVNWGDIIGTLSSQTDLQSALSAKADKTTTVSAGTGLSGGGNLSSSISLALANTTVTPGSYSNASITVDAQGRITSASSGGGSFPSAITCWVYTTTAQSIPQNTITVVNFPQERFDTSSMHDNVTNNSRVTFPQSGYYQVTGSITYTINGSAGTDCSVQLIKNGTTVYDYHKVSAPGNNGEFCFKIASAIDASAGDYVELYVYNTFGGSVTLSTNVGQNFLSAIKTGN